MNPEKESIIQNNLNTLFDSLCDIDSAFAFQACELFELYKERNGGDTDAYTAYEIISTECERIKELDQGRTSGWLYCLAEYLYGKIADSKIEDVLFSEFGFSDNTDLRSSGRVSYLKNKFTISAFDRFEIDIDDAKSLYADSFEDSCEDVYNRICEFCILPIANSKDGPLSVFRNLIAKYNLHIAATTDIADASGTVTTLALLTESIRTPSSDAFSDFRFEFCVDMQSNDCLCGILTAAEKHGFTVNSIDSLTLNEGKPSLKFTFSAEKATIESFKTFVFCLSAIFPSFTPTGIYRHIN